MEGTQRPQSSGDTQPVLMSLEDSLMSSTPNVTSPTHWQKSLAKRREAMIVTRSGADLTVVIVKRSRRRWLLDRLRGR